ncbi:MAG: histidine triad nucleotide-binding protein [Chloroflexota bacterium]
MLAESCPFCRIVRGEAKAAIVHRDEKVVAFRDIHPVAPTHILIIPTKHVASLQDLQVNDLEFMGRMMAVAREIVGGEGEPADGYRLVINTGADAGQSVLHLHMHLLAGRRMQWPPG